MTTTATAPPAVGRSPWAAVTCVTAAGNEPATPAPGRPRTPARLAYEKRRRLLKAQGRWKPDEPAGPVRDYINGVLDKTGMSIAQFADCAGLPRPTVSAILNYCTGRVKIATAARIRAVTPASLPAIGWVDATGSTRRLQALAYAGWPLKLIAPEAGGIDVGWLRQIRAGITSDRVQHAIARKITDAYDRLLPLAPPEDGRYQRVAVTRTRNLAAAEGWVSGWAWDDIDDPADIPRGAIRRLWPQIPTVPPGPLEAPATRTEGKAR